MREVLADIEQWQEEHHQPVALATVVHTWGSAPRKVGAKMALTAGGAISGSVSGGCVEGAVFDAGIEVLETGQSRLLRFGVADETAWGVGLACGGTIEVFVERLDSTFYEFYHSLISHDQPGRVVTIIRGPEGKVGAKMGISADGGRLGTLGEGLDEAAAVAAQSLPFSASHRLSEEIELFVDMVRSAPTLVVVGGVHIAIALTSMANTLGYRTILIDPRRAFGSEARFPHVDQLITAWPDEAFAQMRLTEETAVALLTHDPKIDDPALKAVLASPVFYVGALGSKKTHAKRHERLIAAGFNEKQFRRIHGPIGLDIGAGTPEEIALSIMAEIVQARRQAH